MSQLVSRILVVGLTAATMTWGQIDLRADVINFRTTGDQDHTTTHHGNVDFNGNGNGDVLTATNTSGVSSDRVGVHGISEPAANWGIGMRAEGGYMGLHALSNMNGSGYRYGAYIWSGNGFTNYGIMSTAAGGTGTYENYGVCGVAQGTASSRNIAIFGKATGGSSRWAGYFAGNVYATGSFQTSDARLKKNIKDLDGALAKVMELKPKTYEYDTKGHPGRGLEEGKQIGLLAQDVQEVLPELVTSVPVVDPSMNSGPDSPGDKESVKNPSDENITALDYTSLIPVLIGALQEQQAKIEALETKLK